MKKSLQILIVFAFIFVSFSTKAQVTFQKSYGNGESFFPTVSSLQQTSDGGYIMLGQLDFTVYIQDTIPDWNGYCLNLIKTDANGDTLWTKAMAVGGIDSASGYNLYANSASTLVQTNDGGYFITGTYTDS